MDRHRLYLDHHIHLDQSDAGNHRGEIEVYNNLNAAPD
jgi:hypothetical protein